MQAFKSLVIFLLIFIQSTAFAQRTAEIKKWEELKAPKGFILSNSLFYERNCNQIWTKQVPLFHQRNPHVEDPDVIKPGQLITVQTCKDTPEEVPVVAAKVEVKKEEVKESPKVEEKDFEPIFGPYVHIYGGFLSEKKEEIDPMLGIAVTGDVFNFLGYNIRLNNSPGVITMHNEVRFKTKPAKSRAHLIFGLGNRVGLKNKDLNRLNKGVDSFSYVGVAGEFHPHPRYRLQVDVTTNMGSKIAPNLGVTAQKKFGEDFWFGLYADWYSTTSVVDDSKEDRRVLTGGIKLSF